jgi:plastocyanin
MHRSALRALPVLVIVSVMLWLAVPASAVAIVRGDGTRWRPAATNIAKGGVVRWKAVYRGHVVKSRGSNWSFNRSIAQGESVRRRFRKRGTFKFYCTIHGSVAGGTCTGMCGKIVVG